MQNYVWLFLLGFCLASNSYGQSQESSIDDANTAIKANNFAHAISILENFTAENQNNYDAKYLLAKTYAWNKDIDRGIAALDILLNKFPANSDYLLSKATFLSWQDKNNEAIELLHTARIISPTYQDVWKLEIKLRHRIAKKKDEKELMATITEYESRFGDKEYTKKYKLSKLTTTTPYKSKKSVGFGFGHDELTGKQPDWNDFSLSFSNDKQKYAYSARLEFLNHFNIEDQQLSADYLYKNFYDFQLIAFASLSTEKKLVPSWSLGSQLNRSFGKKGYAEISFKHNTYQDINSDIIRAAYAFIYQKIETKIHALFTIINTSEYVETPGYIIQFSYLHNDKAFIRASYSNNTELENVGEKLTQYDVTSYSIDGRYPIKHNIELSLAFIHHIQDRVYKKNGIHTGLRYIY